jgi:hypothetical protein
VDSLLTFTVVAVELSLAVAYTNPPPALVVGTPPMGGAVQQRSGELNPQGARQGSDFI